MEWGFYSHHSPYHIRCHLPKSHNFQDYEKEGGRTAGSASPIGCAGLGWYHGAACAEPGQHRRAARAGPDRHHKATRAAPPLLTARVSSRTGSGCQRKVQPTKFPSPVAVSTRTANSTEYPPATLSRQTTRLLPRRATPIHRARQLRRCLRRVS